MQVRSSSCGSCSSSSEERRLLLRIHVGRRVRPRGRRSECRAGEGMPASSSSVIVAVIERLAPVGSRHSRLLLLMMLRLLVVLMKAMVRVMHRAISREEALSGGSMLLLLLLGVY